jgi:hypothetical protein
MIRVQEEEEGRCIQSNPLDHSTSLYIRGSPDFKKNNAQVPGYRTNEFVSEAIVMNSSYGIRNRNFHVVLPYIYCDFLVTRRRAGHPLAGPAAAAAAQAATDAACTAAM